MQILWLRNDLRLHDHPGFHLARAKNEPLSIIYIMPKVWLDIDAQGMTRLGAAKARFLRSSLIDLHRTLDEHTFDLTILFGDPVELLQKIYLEQAFTLITASAQAPEEADWLARIAKLGIQIECYEPYTLFSPAQMTDFLNHWPTTFSQFRRTIEKHPQQFKVAEDIKALPLKLRDTALPIWAPAQWPEEHSDTDIQLKRNGGERSGKQHLKDYLWENKSIQHYKATRNALIGDYFSSQLSPYLAWGCLSPRHIWHQILQYEAAYQADEHSQWLKLELLWREYFHWSMRHHGDRLFQKNGLRTDTVTPKKIPEHIVQKHWQAWCAASTGIPMIDAGLVELRTTGFLSNRLRQNMASYFIHQLQLDWRWGARWFEQHLIDFDVASNWGNWAYLAGVGHDARPQRQFNINKQLQEYDPELQHIQHWLPELSQQSLDDILNHQTKTKLIPYYPSPVVATRSISITPQT